MFQQMDQGTVPGVPGTFPTEKAYNMIFITAALVSGASVAMALLVARKKIAPQIMTGDTKREASKDGGAHGAF
jgi:hypothetical protein